MRPALPAFVWSLAVLACADELPSYEGLAAVEFRDAMTIRPLDEPRGLDPTRIALGARLFHDTRLSADHTISCASCHDLASGGVDHRRTSIGIGGAVGPINAPTVLNASLSFRQFWDGRAATLEAQIDGPTQAATQMGSTWPAIVAAVASDPAYVRAFAADYPDGITPDNVRNAIATFERSLVTVDAPFDRWLRGESDAIGADARVGYTMFLDYGCASCHQGVGIGGNMYQRLGILGDYFADRGDETTVDQGRYNVTHLEEDRHVFRVPSLRNVAATAPYFHDGSAPDLPSAVRTMGHYQLGRDLDPSEIDALVAFLQALTGVLPPAAHLADVPS